MATLKTLIDVERLIVTRVPKSALITLATAVVNGLLPAVLSAEMAAILDAVKAGQGWAFIVGPLLWLLAVYVVQALLQAAYTVANNAGVFETVNVSLRADLCRSKGMFPLIRFEQVGFLNALHNAEMAIEDEDLPMLHHTVMTSVEAVISLVSIAFLLATYHPLLCLLALVAALPILINRWLRGAAFDRLRSETAVEARRASRIKSWFYQDPYAKELRVNGAYDTMEARWATSDQARRSAESDFAIKDARQFELCSLLKTVGVLASVLLSLTLAQQGQIRPSQAAAAILAFTAMQAAATSFFQTLGGGRYHLERARGLLSFLHRDDRLAIDARPDTASFSGLTLEGVSFTYPESEVKALKDVTLTLHKGERVAIVGANGSGKTTLAKLVMGQYEPDGGVVRVSGGAPTLAYVPQDIPHLLLTVRAFLSLGAKAPPSDDEMTRALGALDLDFGPTGLDDELGRAFGGRALSGGQWQRLAIAKAALSDADLYVLDEATRAIDPLEESSVLKTLLALTEGKTAFIVTHRLALCPYVDKVLLLDDGRVLGCAPHRTLLNESALYRTMYESQSGVYKDNV